MSRDSDVWMFRVFFLKIENSRMVSQIPNKISSCVLLSHEIPKEDVWMLCRKFSSKRGMVFRGNYARLLQWEVGG